MLKITRDKDELRDTPHITFLVYRLSEDKPTVCGFYTLSYREAGRDVSQGRVPLDLPVMRAFENARHFAEERGISAIWISDRDSLLKTEQIEQMEQSR